MTGPTSFDATARDTWLSCLPAQPQVRPLTRPVRRHVEDSFIAVTDGGCSLAAQ